MISTPTALGPRIREAVAELEQAGVASPRHDAERLAAFVLGVGWSDLWLPSRENVDADFERRFADVVRRRAEGEPLGYVIGSTVFYGLELQCGPGALVPRPETETLVDVGLELIDGIERPVVVDIGTGTGAVALAIAVRRPDARVVATDISVDALDLARANVEAIGVDVELREGDLFEALDDALARSVDLIVSNPPYVPEGAGVNADVHREPRVAVFGGPGGDAVLQRMADEARVWLKPGGALAVEIGEAWQATVFEGAELRNDLSGRPRVAWVRF